MPNTAPASSTARTASPCPASPDLGDLHLVGDLVTSAHVDTCGSVVWMCAPRPDSPALFASLLGTQEHGYWAIRPAGCDRPADRTAYEPDSLVLVQEWDTAGGTLRVTTFMPPCPWKPTGTHGPRLVRIAEIVTGPGPILVQCVFAPRFDYGRTTPDLTPVPFPGRGNRLAATTGEESLWLDVTAVGAATLPADLSLQAPGSAEALIEVRPGRQAHFALTWRPGPLPEPAPVDCAAALDATRMFWRSWTRSIQHRGLDRDAVVRALVTIKALTHAPTGALIAAPTTSLPEAMGGERNWDYRYTWLRDSALMLTTLLRHGHRGEAAAWIEWLVRAAGSGPMQIMYGVDGEQHLPESELHHLPGYANSRPVRIGNGAAGQLQLDVFGEVLDFFLAAHAAGVSISAQATRLWTGLVDRLEEMWADPDEGLWEVRGPRRHFVHSKVMAWVAFDRALKLAATGAADVAPEKLSRWERAAALIHTEVCERGYDPERNTFTQSYGSTDLDAAVLLIARVGFLPPDDKRVIGTVEAIQRELAPGGRLVLRYPVAGHDGVHAVDGLTGGEGAFLLCSFWLVDALALIGRSGEARVLFDRLLALRGATGLLAEEWDEETGRPLGNTPQGFTMAALADTALLLEEINEHYTRPLGAVPHQGGRVHDDAKAPQR